MRHAIALLALAACEPAPERAPQQTTSARAYCELMAAPFCDYYLRCGRMAVDDLAGCRAAFADACEHRYEPYYAALAESGRLALSVDGMGACAAHLREVACEDQLGDLDGACGEMWVGLAAEGAACGPGIDSLVCEAGTSCVLDLSFCGTCEATVPVGAACGEARCADGASCVGGTCVADARPGEPCDEAQPCAIGTWCEEGLCVAPEIVGAGEACDQRRRCAYKAACVGGTCVETGLLGEPCSREVPCASGWCDGGTCAPAGEGGAACSGPVECLSGRCQGGSCAPLPGACFDGE